IVYLSVHTAVGTFKPLQARISKILFAPQRRYDRLFGRLSMDPSASPPMTARPKRRWYQFSLKTLLVVLTLLCLGPGGYVVYEHGRARAQKGAVEAIEKLGGKVRYDPVRWPALRQILRGDSLGNVYWLDLTGIEDVDACLVHLDGLPGLRQLSLSGKPVTDANLVRLAGLKSLTGL